MGEGQKAGHQRLSRSQYRVWILFQSHGKPLEDEKNFFFTFVRKQTASRNCQTLPKWLSHLAFPQAVY